MNLSAPDLTQHPPRSPRVRLGGYVILPRLLDKCRATLAGKSGEYHFACPLDKRWFRFTGIDVDALKAEVAKGRSDGELLEWISKAAKPHRSSPEIEQWSEWQARRCPMDVEGRQFFQEIHQKYGPAREDIATWFDLLDLDDYVSFGGKA
jgi:hypothetical protein